MNKQFVPQNSIVEPYMNKVLKNNFRNGSYLLEFFDVTKQWAGLDEKAKKKIAELVRGHLPVDLTVLSDRIGNFVFQFPVSILSLDIHGTGNAERVRVEVSFDERVRNTEDYQITAEYGV